MRIAMDISHLNHEKLSGIGIYTVELIRALQRIQGVELTPVYRPSRWKYRRFFKMHLGKAAKPWLPSLLEWQADVLHGPDFRVATAKRAVRVATILDLAFLKDGMTSPDFALKKKHDLDRLLDEQTPEALITISEATRRELVAYRPQLADRAHAVLLGGNHVHQLASPLDSELKSMNPYFLFVGNLEARKNVLGILKAFETFCQTLSGFDLVLIGKSGYDGERIVKAVAASPCHDRIRILGYCSMADLQAYYRHAVALVYPSWIEGFGIPVVEAMQLGCPVITSATTSTAEIAGNTGWLVDPSDVGAIARSMVEAAELRRDPGRRQEWVRRGEERAAQFTWERCARETLSVYGKALGQDG
jgi:O-antigen biosynthesis alpha-1,3-mannosyltransferase